MKAINAKNQSIVNKCIKYLTKYNSLNDLRDQADNDGNEKLYNQLEKKCQTAFDQYLDLFYQLPKNQQKAIENSQLY